MFRTKEHRRNKLQARDFDRTSRWLIRSIIFSTEKIIFSSSSLRPREEFNLSLPRLEISMSSSALSTLYFERTFPSNNVRSRGSNRLDFKVSPVTFATSSHYVPRVSPRSTECPEYRVIVSAARRWISDRAFFLAGRLRCSGVGMWTSKTRGVALRRLVKNPSTVYAQRNAKNTRIASAFNTPRSVYSEGSRERVWIRTTPSWY